MEEHQTQADFVFVDRRVGVPLNRAEPGPHLPESASEESPAVRPEHTPHASRLRSASGATKLLLIQTAAALLLITGISIGLMLGGNTFRDLYARLTTQNELRLSAFFEPISEPSAESSASLGSVTSS